MITGTAAPAGPGGAANNLMITGATQAAARVVRGACPVACAHRTPRCRLRDTTVRFRDALNASSRSYRKRGSARPEELPPSVAHIVTSGIALLRSASGDRCVEQPLATSDVPSAIATEPALGWVRDRERRGTPQRGATSYSCWSATFALRFSGSSLAFTRMTLRR